MVALFVPVVVVIAGSGRLPAAAITVFRLLLMRALAFVVLYGGAVPMLTVIVRAGIAVVLSMAGILAIVFHTTGDGAGPPILQRIPEALFRYAGSDPAPKFFWENEVRQADRAPAG